MTTQPKPPVPVKPEPRVSFPRSEILALCAEYGPGMKIDPSQPQLLGKYVMAAVAANESALGANCTPRHEPGWDVGGAYSRDPEQVALLEEFGSAAACSYGAWQVMFYNCSGYTPKELTEDAEAGAKCFLAYFNNYVNRKGAITLEQIGQVYNGGHVTESPIPEVQQYTTKLAQSYDWVTTLF